MALLPSGTLTIAAATLSDRATYRCRLENEAERRESRDAQLKINLDMGKCAFRQIKLEATSKRSKGMSFLQDVKCPFATESCLIMAIQQCSMT